MNSDKLIPRVVELEDKWRFMYKGFVQEVPKNIVRNKKEAKKIADNIYIGWLKRQDNADLKTP